MSHLAELFGLNGQVAVVTGGSGVLGRGLCLGLADAGASVAILGRRQAACDDVAREIRERGGQAVGVSCDVLNLDELAQAVTTVEAVLGPVDILVNGAGGNQPPATTAADRRFFDLSPDALAAVVDLNLHGTLRPSQVFGRGMAERGAGCIINISSMAAMRPLTRTVGYNAAKAAVNNFTYWLAVHLSQEYSPNIRVNAIAPGFFLAEQNRALLIDAATGEWTPRGKQILAHTPMNRLGSPDDLVGTLVWLASPAAAFVTGIVVPVDGGFSAFGGV